MIIGTGSGISAKTPAPTDTKCPNMDEMPKLTDTNRLGNASPWMAYTMMNADAIANQHANTDTGIIHSTLVVSGSMNSKGTPNTAPIKYTSTKAHLVEMSFCKMGVTPYDIIIEMPDRIDRKNMSPLMYFI